MKLEFFLKLVIIAFIYLFLRVSFLWQIPLFEDEALFTGWSLEIVRSPRMMIEPLRAGISPLFSWITAFIFPFFQNQFLAGRVVSVFSGGVLVLFMNIYLRRFYKTSYPLFATLIFTFLPIMFVYTRLALLESLTIMFTFISLAFGFSYVQSPKRSILFFFTLFLICALMTKPLAAIIVPALLGADIVMHWKLRKSGLYLLGASFIAMGIVFLIFLPFRVKTSAFLSDYILITKDSSQYANLFLKNVRLTVLWMESYYQSFLLSVAAFGFVMSLVRSSRKWRYTGITFLLSLFIFLLTDKIAFPRHTLLFAPFIILFVACALDGLRQRSPRVAVLLGLLLLVHTANNLRMIIRQPEQNDLLAKEDRFQFYEDWTSGKILPDIAGYLLLQQKNGGPITVWVDSSMLYYYGLPRYLSDNNAIRIQRLPDQEETFLRRKSDESKSQFLIVNKALPYRIDSREKKLFTLSNRHVVEILRL